MNSRSMMKARALKFNRKLCEVIKDMDDAVGIKTTMKRLKRLFDIKEKVKRNGGSLIVNDSVIYIDDRAIHPSDLEKYTSIDIDKKNKE